jgi:ATP-dependent Lon protease
VLEIGGVKEKVLAAYRSGLRQVIMPKANEKELREVPEPVRQNMAFTFVERMDEVLHLVLAPCAWSCRHCHRNHRQARRVDTPPIDAGSIGV